MLTCGGATMVQIELGAEHNGTRCAPRRFDMPVRLMATLPDYQLLDSLAVQATAPLMWRP